MITRVCAATSQDSRAKVEGGQEHGLAYVPRTQGTSRSERGHSVLRAFRTGSCSPNSAAAQSERPPRCPSPSPHFCDDDLTGGKRYPGRAIQWAGSEAPRCEPSTTLENLIGSKRATPQ